MSLLVSLDSGGSTIVAVPESTTSAIRTTAAASTPKTQVPNVVDTRTQAPIVETPAPVASPTPSLIPLSPATTDNPPPPPPPPPPAASNPRTAVSNSPKQASSTIIPPIILSPTSRRTQPANTIIPLSTLQTQPSDQPTLPASSNLPEVSNPPKPPSQPTPPPGTGGKGSPFETPPGGPQSQNPKPSKNSGKTVGAVIGGLSAAIFLGVLFFFIWKWKTRGRYRFNAKRASFGPYGNGIDANRGGLLVSSVAIKPGDAVSTEESVYEKDDLPPSRYRRPSTDLREPTLPRLDSSSEQTYMPMAGRNTAFDANQQVPASTPLRYPDPNGIGITPVPRPPQRNGPVLYERRRPPLPPSMRRNRSPGHQRSFSQNSPDDSSPSRSVPDLSPVGTASEQSPNAPYQPSPTNWVMSEYATQGTGRSNTMSGELPRPPGQTFDPSRNQRVRRSASLGGRLDQYGIPTIPEVPSGQNSPMSQNPPQLASFTDPWAPLAPPGAKPTIERRLTPDTPKILTIRNPSDPGPNTPPAAEKSPTEKSSPISNIVKRVGSLRQPDNPGFKVQDAAKNF